MKTNDPVETALARRPSDERDYDEPLPALAGVAGGLEPARAHVQARASLVGGRLPGLVALGLALVVTAGVVGSLALRNAGPVGPTPIDSSAQPEPLIGCYGEAPGFSPSQLSGAGNAETADTPGAAALRLFTTTSSPGDYPLRGWHAVSDTPDKVRFLARSEDPPESEYRQVVVRRGASGAFQAEGWFVASYGSCSLRTVPPAGYGSAYWTLDPTPPPTPGLHILVSEWTCHGTEPTAVDRIRAAVRYERDAIVVTVTVKLPEGAQECPLPPPTPYVVDLREPVGGRAILDGGTWPALTVVPGQSSATPTPAPSVQVETSAQTRIYHVGKVPTWTEATPFTLSAGRYYIHGQCSGTDGAFGEAIFRLEQIRSGAVVGEPLSIRCGPTETVQVLGEVRRLAQGDYRLAVESNASSGLTIEIGPESAAPALPAGQVAPRAPANPVAGRVVVPCPGDTQQLEKFPCVFFDLNWTRSDETSSYRIYESWEQVGTPAQPCDPAAAELIIATAGAIQYVSTGIYVPATGSGGLCLYIAAVNSAGESARVQFAGVVLAGEPASGPSAAQTFIVYRVRTGVTLCTPSPPSSGSRTSSSWRPIRRSPTRTTLRSGRSSTSRGRAGSLLRRSGSLPQSARSM